MRAVAAIMFGGLALAACAKPALPDHVFAVFFNNASTDLDDEARDVVDRAASTAWQRPDLPVNVTGYADHAAVVDPAPLSLARADKVTTLLIARGVKPASIHRVAAGSPRDGQPGVESRRVDIEVGYD